MTNNELKHRIIDRLYETSSICSHCKKASCGHGGNRQLVNQINVDDILRAINLDEYFFKEI